MGKSSSLPKRIIIFLVLATICLSGCIYISGCQSVPEAENRVVTESTASAPAVEQTSDSRYFRSNGLPKQNYLIGGGFSVNWTARRSGTVYYVEESTERILMTKTLRNGDVFESSADPEEISNNLGMSEEDIKLSLYFIPSLPNNDI